LSYPKGNTFSRLVSAHNTFSQCLNYCAYATYH